MAALRGELGFAHASATLATVREEIGRGSGPVELDLSQVTRVDSAGLALLLEAKRLATARGRALQLRSAPEQVRRLADFFGVAQLLALSA